MTCSKSSFFSTKTTNSTKYDFFIFVKNCLLFRRRRNRQNFFSRRKLAVGRGVRRVRGWEGVGWGGVGAHLGRLADLEICSSNTFVLDWPLCLSWLHRSTSTTMTTLSTNWSDKRGKVKQIHFRLMEKEQQRWVRERVRESVRECVCYEKGLRFFKAWEPFLISRLSLFLLSSLICDFSSSKLNLINIIIVRMVCECLT